MSRNLPPSQQPPPMPGNVKAALSKRGLMDAYHARPRYQQDDYLRWIAAAIGEAAKAARRDQMLAELEAGNAFKGAPWTPPPPKA